MYYTRNYTESYLETDYANGLVLDDGAVIIRFPDGRPRQLTSTF
jgi:hypothetical protein